jgi:hypothetical protein
MNTELAYDIEEKANSTIEFNFLTILEFNGNDFKEKFHLVLDSFSETVNSIESTSSNIKLISRTELESYYKTVKRLNSFFLKMHDKFQSKNYLDDKELKTQFKTISKRLNAIEFTCFKYLMKDEPVDKTPEYIVQGLAEFSKEAIGEKLLP